ncbi:UNVERIFIED_CONTAM: hypothetical protein FKN15_018118, partial [Acipenser sinensis]
INRAHQVYGGGPQDSNKPCTMIFQCLRHTDRQRLLQAARKSAPIIMQGQRLSFYLDYSVITAAKRRAFGEVRVKLRSQGVDNFLVYPAILEVNNSGERLSFTTPEEVDSFLLNIFRIRCRLHAGPCASRPFVRMERRYR